MNILVTVNDGRIAMNIVRTDAFRQLLAEPDVYVTLLVNARKADYYRASFSGPRVTVIANTPSPQTRFELAFALLCLNSIPTFSLRIWQRTRYWEKGRYGLYTIAALCRFLGRFRAWRALLRLLNRSVVPVPAFYPTLLDTVQPDGIFATNMMSRDDVALLRLAKKRGIPSVGMIKSWDNPTTKSFIRDIPDTVIVHTELLKEEVVQLFDVPRERVVVSGLPQYDLWTDRSLLLSRDAFFAKIGADPAKRLLVYAAAGDWMNQADADIVRFLSGAIISGTFGPAQLLVRLHPKYASTAEQLATLPHVIVERPGTHVTKELVDWEYEDADTLHLMNTLAWSDVVMNTASTFTIDAAIFDKPIILIGYDGARQLPYDASVIRYYDREHMCQIMESGGATLVRSDVELAAAIIAALEHPEQNVAGRAAIVAAQCYRLDGKSGARVADALLATFRRTDKQAV